MTRIIKNNLIILTGLSFSILGFLLLPNFSLATDNIATDNICKNPCQGITDCYFVEFAGPYLQVKGHPNGHQSSMEKTISLPYSGIYEVSTCYRENTGLLQLYEEYNVFVKGKNIGHTNDSNVVGPRKENLGKRQFPSGNHQVKVEHRWWYYQVSSQMQSQSIFPINVVFVLKEPLKPILTISKSANKTSLKKGEILTYTLFYQNTGNLKATGITIVDDYYESYFEVYNSSGGSVGAGKITWLIGELGPGRSASKVFQLKVKETIPQGIFDIANTAIIDSNEIEPQASPTIYITIDNESQTLYVALEAIPYSGSLPLNDVDLKATVSGTAIGSINYKFDCQNDGSWEYVFYNVADNPKTVVDACDYLSGGTYNAKVYAERGTADPVWAQATISVSSSWPTVDIKASGSDGPITISYNTPATLSWNSANTDYCYASNDWTGSKSKSGSETTGNLISSKTYTLTCSGTGGSASDSVMVNVTSQPGPGNFTITKLVRNLSDGTAWADSVLADPGEIISFWIQAKNSGSSLGQNVIIRDVLPEKISFSGDLRIDGILTGGDIISGLNIGDLSPNQSKTITFNAYVARADQFTFGNTQLENRAFASAPNISVSDIAIVIVRKAGVLGATTISTGLTNNLLLDSFILPLIISLIIVFLFRWRIIKWEEWLDKRKIEYKNYKVKKLLEIKIAKIKAEEFFKKIF